MAAEKTNQPTKVITNLVRFSYCHVFKPEAMEEGETPKYSVALLIPKKDKAGLQKIKKGLEAAIEAGIPIWGGKKPAKLKLPLRDGDEERPDDAAYQGMYFLNATSSGKPGVVDENLDPIIDQNEFYSGCWGRASIKFFAFNKKGNQGVAAGLNNLQKLKDGDPLANISTPEDDFSEDQPPIPDDLDAPPAKGAAGDDLSFLGL